MFGNKHANSEGFMVSIMLQGTGLSNTSLNTWMIWLYLLQRMRVNLSSTKWYDTLYWVGITWDGCDRITRVISMIGHTFILVHNHLIWNANDVAKRVCMQNRMKIFSHTTHELWWYQLHERLYSPWYWQVLHVLV